MISIKLVIVVGLICQILVMAERGDKKPMLTCHWTPCGHKNYARKCPNGFQQKSVRKCSLSSKKSGADYKQAGLYRRCCKYV